MDPRAEIPAMPGPLRTASEARAHIFYECAGTGTCHLLSGDGFVNNQLINSGAAFATALALIPEFGNNYSFIITPIFFAAAACVWFFITNLN